MQGGAASWVLGLYLLVAMFLIPARADNIPPCTLPDGVRSMSLENGTPPALLWALTRDLGEYSPPGGHFDATDVVVTGRSRRLIFIWNAGRRWVVATEHGGIGYNNPILAYDLNKDDEFATLVATRIAFPKSVCSTATGLLAVP